MFYNDVGEILVFNSNDSGFQLLILIFSKIMKVFCFVWHLRYNDKGV